MKNQHVEFVNRLTIYYVFPKREVRHTILSTKLWWILWKTLSLDHT